MRQVFHYISINDDIVQQILEQNGKLFHNILPHKAVQVQCNADQSWSVGLQVEHVNQYFLLVG